ncbi:carboxylesterase family protein [Streptomyces sp. A7024]|uniref:Carboxylic ester hydrolase n=2 Tax=Streptomyces coryli TaxID=1128680 RepID=A0A6G4U4H0_9ACTN|nr:carboxylesterase family protein [Streptomyces coryli]NGN67135.1 carboxylesterase family protein [Streptomyces coryli]
MTGRARRCLGVLLGLIAALAVVPLPAAHADGGGEGATVVRTTAGAVRGEVTGLGRQFLGIPYAADPVGKLRWQPPRPHARWSGVRDATDFSNRCVQGSSWDPGYEQPTHTEDCLSLNVYAPKTKGAQRDRPVLVWFHGGGLTAGAGSDVVPDTFADASGAVVVTINYRLGAMGFLSLPGLQESGNYGMLDQQAALRWVRANAARFGGDADKVTIAGESAGGRSVCDQLASPGARGLFRGAVIQSGAYDDCNARTRAAADADGLAFAKKLGCEDAATVAACLRAKPAAELLKAQSGHNWNPVVGSSFLPRQPAEAFASGEYPRVPVVNGANRDEGTLFAFGAYDGAGKPLTAEQYPAAIRNAFGAEKAEQVLRAYPLSAFKTPTLAYAAAVGDQLMACPADRLNSRIAGTAPVYAYEFADETGPPFASLRNLDTDFPFGATHVNELQYLFRHFGLEAPFTAAEKKLSRQMTAYWSSFVRTGRPTAPGLPAMPEQSRTPGKVLTLQTAPAGGPEVSGDFGKRHHCEVWGG